MSVMVMMPVVVFMVALTPDVMAPPKARTSQALCKNVSTAFLPATGPLNVLHPCMITKDDAGNACAAPERLNARYFERCALL